MKYHRSVYRALSLITQFSINMLVPIFLCSFLGIYLDRKLETSFWMILLFFLGAMAGFRNVYKMAATVFREKSERDRIVEKQNLEQEIDEENME